jgi:hypothetical protein
MNLHENKKLFTDAVFAASEYLDIRPVYIEKDYWITRSLKLMAQNPDADKMKNAQVICNQNSSRMISIYY